MPPINDPLRLAALRAAALLLSDAAEAMPAGPLTVPLSDGFHRVTVTIEPERYGLADLAGAGQPAGSGQAAGQVTGELADLIRVALVRTDRPLKIVTLARRCDRDPPTSHFRRVVQLLVAAGELLHLPGHYYWLASRPRPEQRGAAGAG